MKSLSQMWSFCILKYSRVKCEIIFPTAKAWPRLAHETGKLAKSQQQIHYRMVKKERRINATLAQSNADLNLIEMLQQDLKRAVN